MIFCLRIRKQILGFERKNTSIKEINTEEFDLEVLHGGKVVLDFYSTECTPCEALASKKWIRQKKRL
jgi:thiol-disulfide isomerase/thioredoxin